MTCRTHVEVMQAIRDMVTQSAGPYTAAGMGMALAAWECREKPEEEQLAFLQQAAACIADARPTTQKRMEQVCIGCTRGKAGAEGGRARRRGNPRPRCPGKQFPLFQGQRDCKVSRRDVPAACGGYDPVLRRDNCRDVKEAELAGKQLRLFCPETRPYFQGARLTATVCHDMGFDVTVITDNMPAFVMQREGIDVFTCAADAICLDGYVVNKVGTFQIAICANHFGIPTFVTVRRTRGTRQRTL